jgi:hypothetical protein
MDSFFPLMDMDSDSRRDVPAPRPGALVLATLGGFTALVAASLGVIVALVSLARKLQG